MKRNIVGRGAATIMAEVLAVMMVLFAVPALPARAVGADREGVAETEEAVIQAGVKPDADSDGGVGGEASVSNNNAELDERSLAKSGTAVTTGTIWGERGLLWSYDANSHTLTITGSGVWPGRNALSVAPLRNLEIKRIEFKDCKVTGSMSNAFGYRGDIEEIDCSGLDTVDVTDMKYMFGGSKLHSIDLSGVDTGSVTDMRGMFSGCNSLVSLDLSSFDTGNVTDMGEMFSGCSSLVSLDLSSFDTGNVTHMGSMFSGCSSLVSLDLSSFDTGNVTHMWSMFSGCSSLESLDLSSFDTGNVTGMGSMFSGCSSLESLDLSSFDTGSVTGMGYMFQGCSSLESLDLSGFDTGSVTTMESMFQGCSGLRSLDLSGFDASSVTTMQNMFSGCSSLISLDLSEFGTGSVTNMENMFTDCSSLASLDLSGFDTGNVVWMGNMFMGCSSLVSLDLSGFDTGSAAFMARMFADCSSLISLDLSSFDTANVVDVNGGISGMFNGCSSLRSLDLSSFNVQGIIYTGIIIFQNCNSLSRIHTPYNVKVSAALPAISDAVWHLPDGTEITELPRNLGSSVLITRSPVITTTTEALNLPDVVRVKYVPYSYTVQTDNTDSDNQVTFSVVEGRLAEGLQMYPTTGEIYGVPLEAGEFRITVQADYSNPKYPSSRAELTLIVLENTDDNVGTATDSGYEITQPVPDLNTGSLSGSGTQLLVSEGEYAEFQDAVYLDGRRLQSGVEYTSEAGSTRITIQNQTLADAGTGSHTLSLEFRTQDTGALRRAAQNLVISGAGSSGDTGNTGTDNNTGNTGGSNTGTGTGNNTGNTGESNTDNSAITDNGDNGSMADDGEDSGGDMNNTADRGPDDMSASNSVKVIDYIVQSGDNLWKIAARFYGNGRYWRQIYMDNADVIRYPDRLRTGWHLKIRLTAGNGTAVTVFNAAGTITGGSYTVQPGDNLWRIAGKVYGKSERWREIYEANRNVLTDPERIYVKQVLAIP